VSSDDNDGDEGTTHMSKKSTHQKTVPPKGKSPGVPKDATGGHKYSTGEAGRSAPPKLGQTHKSRTNP
jgi:hypothetical protein